MLIDTGCTKTMVSSKYLNSNSLNHVNTEEILCVYGDKVCYPTAEVKLRLGQWSRTAKVVAAADMPVPVLLGTDIYALALNFTLASTYSRALTPFHRAVSRCSRVKAACSRVRAACSRVRQHALVHDFTRN